MKRSNIKLFIDRALSRSIGQQFVVMVFVLLGTLAISYMLLLPAYSKQGWAEFCFINGYDISYWLLPIYLLIDTNALNNLYMCGANSWLLVASSIVYIFGLLVCSGMLIGVITNYIDHRVKNHRDGLVHYVKSGHYVIMGYDEMVPSIITGIFEKDENADVVLLTAMDANSIREKLLRSIARDKMDQIFITYGHRMVKDYYKDVHLEKAVEVYIVGNRTRSAHDAINVECIDSIGAYLSETKAKTRLQRITCVFEDLDTYSSFKTTEIFSQIRALGIEFIPYNFYEGWARQVFVNRCYKEKNRPDETIAYPSVYGEGIGPYDKKHVHLVFIGTSNFSVACAMEAAHHLHFANFENDNSQKTRITFIEQNADQELREFATRNRHFFEIQPYLYQDIASGMKEPEVRTELVDSRLEHTGFLDVEFEFIKGDVYSLSVQNLLRTWAEDDEQHLSLFIAMADQRKNFMIGMNLPDEVYDCAVPVFIRQDRADDFVTNLRQADGNVIEYCHVKEGNLIKTARKGRYANLYPFGMDDMAYYTDETANKRAKLINYLYCHCSENHFPDQGVLDSTPTETIWEEANKAWNELSVALKWSNLYAAYSIYCKLNSLRAMSSSSLTEEDIEALAATEHNRWNVEKLLMGYRKARPEEDKYIFEQFSSDFNKTNKKKLFIHHDIRPFSDLDDIKLLDYEFSRFIPWIVQMTDN